MRVRRSLGWFGLRARSFTNQLWIHTHITRTYLAVLEVRVDGLHSVQGRARVDVEHLVPVLVGHLFLKNRERRQHTCAWKLRRRKRPQARPPPHHASSKAHTSRMLRLMPRPALLIQTSTLPNVSTAWFWKDEEVSCGQIPRACEREHTEGRGLGNQPQRKINNNQCISKHNAKRTFPSKLAWSSRRVTSARTGSALLVFFD